MLKTILTAAATAGCMLVLAGPAMAAPFCDGGSTTSFEFSVRVGSEMTERERGEFAMMELRQRGVDTDRVEFWGGCLRAFVRRPDGSTAMEYYDPHSFRQVY